MLISLDSSTGLSGSPEELYLGSQSSFSQDQLLDMKCVSLDFSPEEEAIMKATISELNDPAIRIQFSTYSLFLF